MKSENDKPKKRRWPFPHMGKQFLRETEWLMETCDEAELSEYPIVDELPSEKSSGRAQKPLFEDENELTLQQLAQEMDLTREKVRQIEAKALQKLRSSRLAKDLRFWDYD